MAQYIFTMNGVGKIVPPKKFILKDIFLNFFPGAKIGVLLDLVGGDDQLGKDLAMHIAASKPKALNSEGVPAELLETERRIAIEKARADNKPEAMLEKIADGTVQKYLKDVTLLAQVFVKAEDGKQTI